MNPYELFRRAYHSKNPIWTGLKNSPNETYLPQGFSSPVVLAFSQDLELYSDRLNSLSGDIVDVVRHLVKIYPTGFTTVRGGVKDALGEIYHWKYPEQYVCRSRIIEIRRLPGERAMIILDGKVDGRGS